MRHLNECMRILNSVTINEAVSNADFEKARALCRKFFTKYGIGVMTDINNISVDGKHYYSSFAYCMSTNLGCALLWAQTDKSSELDGIVFYDDITKVLFGADEGETAKSECGMYTSGISLTKLIPLIKDMLTGKLSMDKKTLEKSLEGYQITEDFETEMGELINEDIEALRKKRNNLSVKINNAKKAGKDFTALQKEYDDIRSQINSMMVSGSQKVSYNADPEVDKLEQQFEERVTPEERFADMDAYVRMVCNGVQPSLVVCGAPGVGKSYRILKQVEKRHTFGDDYYLIKGKCTAQKFFQILFEYREEGDIIVCDDADDIIRDDTSINLIKAATDSSEKRLVTYGTTMAPPAPMDLVELHPEWPWNRIERNGREFVTYPTTFEFKGSIIIISNMRAGMIDTAIRNRAFVCDLDFTIDEVLSILRGLIPAIMPGRLGSEAKMKAFDFLQSLADEGNSNMEISIRSFITCAKIYEDLPPSEEKAAERRIKEQMRNQFARGGKKY